MSPSTFRARVVRRADHDAVGKLEIADRSALAQKFRIGCDDDIGRRIGFADQPLDLVAGADRHGRFGDYHGKTGKRCGDLARGGIDVTQIGMTIAAPRRRSDRDEYGIGLGDRLLEISGEIEPLCLDVGRHQRIEPGLENRHLAAAKGCDLARILVHAGDLVAEIRKAGARHQPHIARANHGNSHNNDPYLMVNANIDFVGVLEHFSPEGKPQKRSAPASCLYG